MTGQTPDQVRQTLQGALSQYQATNQYNPWDVGANNLYTGTLWTGMGADPTTARHPGLPEQRPGGTKTWQLTWGGHAVQITTPDFGPDVHVSINSTFGENPSHADVMRAAQDPNRQRIWVEIRDKNNKPLYSQDVNMADNEATNILLGTHPILKAPGKPDLALNADPYAGDQGQLFGGPQVDQTSSVQEELKKLYDADPGKLWNMKNELWLAGYYSSGTKLDDVSRTSLTNDDIAAFASVMMAATRYWAAGKRVTWQDLLSWQAADPSAKKRAAKADATPPNVLTDPARITKDAHDAATQILGRDASSEDVSTLVSLIHARETAVYKKQVAAAGGQVEGVDQAADIDQYFRQHYPNEAMAVDWGAAANVWNQSLAQTSPQPRIVGGT